MSAPGDAAATGAGSTKPTVPKLPPTASRDKDAWEIFCLATRTILDKWDLLHSAVEEEWGGRNSKGKYEHIVDDLFLNAKDQWRDGNDLHLDTLDVYLIECLEADFNITFEEDDEVTLISMLIQDVYRKCASGDIDGVKTVMDSLDKHPAMQKGDRVVRDGSDDEESGDDEEEEASAAATKESEPKGPRRVVDEDGWETIAPKKGKGKTGSETAGVATDAGVSDDMSKLSVDDSKDEKRKEGDADKSA